MMRSSSERTGAEAAGAERRAELPSASAQRQPRERSGVRCDIEHDSPEPDSQTQEIKYKYATAILLHPMRSLARSATASERSGNRKVFGVGPPAASLRN